MFSSTAIKSATPVLPLSRRRPTAQVASTRVPSPRAAWRATPRRTPALDAPQPAWSRPSATPAPAKPSRLRTCAPVASWAGAVELGGAALVGGLLGAAAVGGWKVREAPPEVRWTVSAYVAAKSTPVAVPLAVALSTQQALAADSLRAAGLAFAAMALGTALLYEPGGE